MTWEITNIGMHDLGSLSSDFLLVWANGRYWQEMWDWEGKDIGVFLFWVFYWGALYMLLCLRPQLLYCNNPFFCWVTVMTFSPWLYQPKKGSGVMFLLAPGYYMSLMCPLNLNPACTFVLVSSFGFLQSLFMRAPPVPSHTWTVSQFLYWELIPPSFVLLV